MKWFDDEFEREFNRMRQRMERILGGPSRSSSAALVSPSGWRPSVDLYETAAEFLVLASVAGVRAEEVDVVVEQNVLKISGYRRPPLEQEVTRIHQMEIDFGPFSHAVRLPMPVNVEAASSVCRDGFLLIRLPKRPRAVGTINVRVDE